MHEDIALECEVTRFDREVLEVSYRVLNNSGDPIFLLTPLTEFGDEGLVEAPDKVYVTVEPNGALRLAKEVSPVPDDIDVYLPEVPRLTEVPSGHYFEETLRCPLPVRLSCPYRDADASRPEHAPELLTFETTGVVLSIACIVGRDAVSSMWPVDAEGGATFAAPYGELCAHQSILRGELMSIRVPVRDIQSSAARRSV